MIAAHNQGEMIMSDEVDKEPSKWGKGKTDPDSWWKKGCKSPNPKGRPKGSKNQKTIYEEAFGKKVSVNLDGVPATMPKKEVTYHQIANKAAAGDPKATAIQLELDAKFDPGEDIPPTKEESAADFATLDEWISLREKCEVFAKPSDESDDESGKPEGDD